MSSVKNRKKSPKVAVIGGGFSGISAGYMLNRYGIEDFTIFDRSPGVGGTWWHNRYPGAEVDTESVIYSLSFSRWPWSRTHAEQEEILEYIDHTVDSLDLRKHFKLNTEVRNAKWLSTTEEWELEFAAGETERFDAVISAVGFLDVPNIPDWAKNKNFKGEVIHASRWGDVDLVNKRVAVVGTGSTAVQIIGEIPKLAKEVVVFQRQPNWILPKSVQKLGKLEAQSRTRGLSYYLHRIRGFIRSERGRVGGKAATAGTKANLASLEAAKEHMRKSLSGREDLIPALTPDYPFNGKRPVINDTFYPALKRENVKLVPHAVSELAEDSIIDATGENHEIDLVVLATGFLAADYLHDLPVVGVKGKTLKETWNGEPRALAGITVPDFPNFFIMYGPNTNAGPVPFFLEAQARFAALALRRGWRLGKQVIDTKPNIEESYDKWVQKKLAKTVWGKTRSYFMAGSGRVVTQWPTGATQYWMAARLMRRIGLKFKKRQNDR